MNQLIEKSVGTSDKIMFLYYAQYGGNVTMLAGCIKKGVNVNIADDKGFTALHYAVIVPDPQKSFEAVSFLIENGANVNSWSKAGITPLHCAASVAHPKVVKLLLGRGANPNARTNDNRSPADWTPSKEIEKLLVKHGGAPKADKTEGGAQSGTKKGLFKRPFRKKKS